MLMPERHRRGDFDHIESSPPTRRGAWARQDLFGRRKDGTEFPIDVIFIPIETAQGRLVLAAIMDLTDRKAREKEYESVIDESTKELLEQRRLLRQVIDLAPNLIFIKDREGRFTLANKAVADIYGTTPEMLVGKTDADLGVKNEEAEGFRRDDNATMDSRKEKFIQEPVTAGGRMRWFQTTKLPLEEKDGSCRQVLGVSTDITARREAELNRVESEERFRQLAENIDEVFWVTNPAKSIILYVSPAYAAIWGRTCASLLSSPLDWLESIHPDDRERVSQAAATRQAAGEYLEEYRIVRPDGTLRWIRDRAFPVKNAAGKIYRIVGVAQDITERRLGEDALRSEIELRTSSNGARRPSRRPSSRTRFDFLDSVFSAALKPSAAS